MDLNTAILLGLLEQQVENILPTDLTNIAGQVLTVSHGTTTISYTVITTFYGNDLATDMNPERGNQIVSFGAILQDTNKNVVIAIRGTDGIWEWVHDAEFLSVPCPFLASAGRTDDGFTAIYKSLKIAAASTSLGVAQALATLPPELNFNTPINSVTICGHSLGGALATLLALDIAANTSFKNPTVYTYASPRTGDPVFVTAYNGLSPNTSRIANRMDIVPKLPLPPQYEHVNTLFEINSVTIALPPKLLVKLDIGCEHHMTTYLYLLSLKGPGPVLPLDADCAP
ncbi:MAG: lipase family protein [Verrucomicrobiia bacterium]